MLFKSLADPTRRAIFEQLCRKGEQTVGALTIKAGVSQPAVSKHLGALKQAGLVRERFANRRLFVLPHNKSWTGRGKSDICVVCSKPIFAAESSQEVIGVRRAHVHLVCYRAWLLESIAVRQSDERSSAESNDTTTS